MIPIAQAQDVKPAKQAAAATVRLFARNTEIPFCYVAGGRRAWAITSGPLTDDIKIHLTARRADSQVLAKGQQVGVDGCHIRVTAVGKLEVSDKSKNHPAFQLEVQLRGPGNRLQKQTLRIRPAPPARPVSYVSDLSSEIIRIFWDGKARRFRPITQDAFDQYFRRLQAHGIQRVVVWQSPFPFIGNSSEFSAQDWKRYVGQARAIRDSEQLEAAIRGASGLPPWCWLREVMSLRLRTDLGRLYAGSAADHGIKLTASFRPFEHSLGKYYEIPTFDQQGNYLWGFSPLASPAVNYHRDQVGFAHVREVLQRAGERLGDAELGAVASLEWHGLPKARELAKRFADGHRDLEVVASAFPPLDSQSFVLVRRAAGQFSLRRVQDVSQNFNGRLRSMKGLRLHALSDSVLRIEGLRVPPDCHILRLRAVSEFAKRLAVPADLRIMVRTKAGHPLGRGNMYWSLAENEEQGRLTRVGPITADGGFRAEFQATQNSIKQLVARKSEHLIWNGNQAVINLGRRWSMEMVDFQQPAARRYAVAQLKSLLAFPAYDEILINTRSHTQLAGSDGEAKERVDTIYRLLREKYRLTGYRSIGRTFIGLGIDRGYAPRAVAKAPALVELLRSKETRERISTSQHGEWQATCQQADSPYQWRYQRNVAVAAGVRALLVDLEKAFPATRIRAVIPQSGRVDRATERGLSQMRKPDGKVYGMSFFRHVWSTNNYINVIGEGMTMIDLTGTRVEPVFLGVRFAPDQGPLKLFVDQSIDDLASNRGSSFRGPKSFFYEAQETLRAPYRDRFTTRRHDIIRYLLSRSEINEVLLYEAADWTYYLPIDDPHQYLDKPQGAAKD